MPLTRLTHLPDDLIEGGTIDQFHGVEVRALLFAYRVNGHDVRVMQPGGGLCFAAKALHCLRRQTQAAEEHFQSDLAIEGCLNRRIDDSHTAAADLAENLEVAQAFGVVPSGSGCSAWVAPFRLRLDGHTDSAGQPVWVELRKTSLVVFRLRVLAQLPPVVN